MGLYVEVLFVRFKPKSVTVELDDSYFLGQMNFLDDPTGKIV
jgi:hypothetical protein